MQEIVSEHLQNPPLAVDKPCWYHAMTFMERLTSLRAQRAVSKNEEPYDREHAERRLQEWKKQDAFHKGIDFAQRLEADQLTEEDLLVLLGEPIEAVQRRTPPPDWLLQLAEVFASVDTSFIMEEKSQQAAHLSLLNIFDIFSIYAYNHFMRQVTTLEAEYNYLPFDSQTIASVFLPNLMLLLSQTIHRTMVLELNVARLQGRLHGETPQERFQDFIRQTRQKQALQALLEEYPVLARQIMTFIHHWLNYSQEFLHHLCSDWQQICTTFSPARDPGLLIEAQAASSDVHHNGRSVIKLRFSSGLQLLYRPEPVELDLHFQEMLTWLNEQGYQPPFRTMRFLPAQNYGWSEFVEASECTTQTEIVRFYERQGGYLALLYALNTTQFQPENLVANGEHPMLRDLEALFYARPKDAIDLDAAMDVLHLSVMRVGMLPMRIFLRDAPQNLDLNTRGEQKRQQTPQSNMYWAGGGTDQMHLVRDSHELLSKQNRPKLNGNEVDPLEYQQCLVAGFDRMYRLLMARREEFTRVPLTRFASDEIRRTVRPTHFYSQFLNESFHPDLLRDALERDCYFDHLWQAVTLQPDLVRLISFERSDLPIGDIPLFSTRLDTRALFSSRTDRIDDFFEQPGITIAQQAVQNLHEDHLQRQRWFIETSLTSLLLDTQPPMAKQPTVTVPSGKEVTRERLLAAACRIGDRLCTLAAGDWRGINWVGIAPLQDKQWFLTSTMPDLYEGNTGIMFFLSYLGIITGDTRYSDAVEAAYVTMHAQIERFEAHPQAVDPFDSLGSVIYLLSHLGALWNDHSLLTEAHRLAKRLSDLLQKEAALDLLSGSAGCVLSLLSLYHTYPEPGILALACMCADRLPTKDGLALESYNSAELRTRTLHGTAGRSLSLFALAAISGEDRFHRLALATLAHERGMFSFQAQNWSDILPCLASLRYIDDEKIRGEVIIALKTSVAPLGRNYSLGHGDLGNLETLLIATQILDDPWCREQFNHCRGLILDSIETDGWLTGAPLGIETPGLMTGLAGIGYELLRLAEPERVPSVLVAAPPLIKLPHR